MTKVIFFGSSNYSVVILQALLQSPDFTLTAVVTKPDKAVGRQATITPNPVAKFATNHHLPLLQPTEFSPEFTLEIRNLKFDIGLCIAYGPPFFTPEILALFPHGIVNIHPSPLPLYRGATPGPWQIINGEAKSAITFFKIDELPDHGPIIAQIPFDISPAETAASFYTKAFDLAAAQLDPTLKSYILNHQSILKPQDHSKKTYFPKFTKESARIDWRQSPTKIDRFIRAMNPWPIAHTFITSIHQPQKLTMKIFSARLDGGQLIPNLVQIEGKKPTSWLQIKDHYSLIKI